MRKLWMTLLFITFGMIINAYAEDEKLTGYDIIKKTREIKAPDDQSATVTLTLINKDGSSRKIVTTRYWKNYRGNEGFDTKTVFFTTFPPDSRGVGFLIWDYKDEGKPDDLWLYLPALRQVRRVSARDKDDAFMGSDLTFADMGQRTLEEDTHTLAGSETLDGVDCFVVESVPKNKEGIYSKRVIWISKKDLITLKVDYYDTKKELLKTQNIEWDKVGDLWVFNNIKVRNVQTEHKTIYAISDLKNNIGVNDEYFKERTLKTGIR